MSLYAEYIKEREDKEIIETDKGFATFKCFDNKECYLQDLYVCPEYRKTKIATDMTDEVVAIARERGCSLLVGSVCVDDKYATRNMKVFLAYGMQIYKTVGTMIFLKKEIN
jgi:ribosomal protein S18 acetylase RimI-like enzyme